jgi:polyisoprenoid-binding protein YceI
MKHLPILFALALFVISCNTEKKTALTGEAITTDSVKNATAMVYAVDLVASSLSWTGSEGFAFNLDNSHHGTFNLAKGSLLFSDSTLAGTFEVDIKSLKVLDIKKEASNKKLSGHLLGADFFEAKKFPIATFEIISSQSISRDSTQLTGNLTLKGVTKSVVIPAFINKSDSTIQATAKFYINRKDWGMHYRTEASFGDELIRPEVLIELNIFAKK